MGHNEQQGAVMSDKFVLVVSDEKDDKHGDGRARATLDSNIEELGARDERFALSVCEEVA